MEYNNKAIEEICRSPHDAQVFEASNFQGQFFEKTYKTFLDMV